MPETNVTRMSAKAAVWLTLLLQAILILFAQRHEWSYLTERPFLQEDMAFHWYVSSRYAQSIQAGAGYAAYDPALFGGTNISPVNSPSDRLPVLLLVLSPQSIWPLVFNMHYLVLCLLIPPLLVLALLRFGISPVHSLYGGLVATAVFWLLLLAFLQTGLISFAFVVAAGMWAAAELYRLSEKFTVGRALLVSILPGALIYVHPAAAFTTLLFLTPVLILRAKRFDKRVWLYALTCIIVAVLLNFHWLLVMSQFASDRISTTTYMSFSSWQDFWEYHTERKGFQLYRIFGPLILVALTYRWATRNADLRDIARLAAIWIVLFLAAYTFGSFIPVLDQLQPRRFGAVVALALAIYVAILIANWKPRISPRPISVSASFAITVLICAWWVSRAVSWQGYDASYLASTLPNDPLNDVAELVRDHCPPDTRILLVGFAKSPVRDNLCFLAHFAPREYFGDGATFASLCKFGTDGVGFDRRLQDGTATESDWQAFRHLWGIEYVLAPEDMPLGWGSELREIARSGGHSLLSSGPRSRFLVGAGSLRAALNRIDFRDVVTQDGRVVVSYHHSIGLKLAEKNPGTHILRSEGDGYGLIEITNPPKDFALTFSVP